MDDEATYAVHDEHAVLVQEGGALACLITLLEKLDAVDLLELERHHLPRVKAMRPPPLFREAERV